MQLVKIPFAVVVGGMFTTALFWLLWSLVGTSFDTGERVEARRIEFSHMRPDTQATTKRAEKVERKRPPPTPDTPRIAISAGGVENNIARITPIVDATGSVTRTALTAGSDRDVIPLVRVNPDYPPRAATRGQEGWVQVQFTITATGTVKDAIVVDAMPPSVFDDAALKAIARWRYNPKVENGVAVERVGVQAKIVFQLEN